MIRRPARRSSLRRSTTARGLTLPEVLLAAVILSFATITVTQAISTGHAQTYDALHSDRAVSLAEAMLEEVLTRDYDDDLGETALGPDTGETTRADFDNYDDFHGLTEAPPAIADAAGSVYPDLFQRFTRSVTVAYDTVSVTEFGGAQDGVTITVTVTDTDPDTGATGRSWTVDRFVPEPDDS